MLRLAVNAYVEPVTSLDLDIVVLASSIDDVLKKISHIFDIKKFPDSINLYSADSDIRIQIQTDERYQDFLNRAEKREILGYEMKTAAIEDVLSGKIWAYSDIDRPGSKRQKDLTDIQRMLEDYPQLRNKVPPDILNKII